MDLHKLVGTMFCNLVASSNMSRLEAHEGFFRLLMKGIFGLYVLHSWVLGVDNLAKWQKNMLQLKLFGGLFGHKSADF